MEEYISQLERIAALQKSNDLTKDQARAMKEKVLRDAGIQTEIEDPEPEEYVDAEEVQSPPDPRIPVRVPSGMNDQEVHTCVWKVVDKFVRENPQMKTGILGRLGTGKPHYMKIWNQEQQWKRLILENHSVHDRTTPGLLTTVTLAKCKQKGESNPGEWMKEFQWETGGNAYGGRTFFDPAGHPVEKVQEILNKLL